MKLHYNPASPFTRKVRVVAIETGREGEIELLDVRLTPVEPAPAVVADNPLGKVPCLVTDDAGALYDSRVIAEYLDGRHDRERLFPAPGPVRWTALRRQALGDGIMDAAVLTRYETVVRPAEKRWDDWIQNQALKWRRALDRLEDEAPALGATVDIGTIALACALGYLDFRFPDDRWRDGRPRLASWFERFTRRDSMVRTEPEA